MNVTQPETPGIAQSACDRRRRTAVVLASVHHGNTRKIAEMLADVLKADLLSANDVSAEDLKR
jgi:hypothetical protein